MSHRLLTVLTVLAALAAPVAAGPVPVPVGQLPAKNEDVDKAIAAVQNGKFDEALKLLQDAVKKQPDLPPARLIYVQILSQMRDMGKQARNQLELAGAENPDHPAIYLQNGVVAVQEGRLTDAIVNCEKVLLLADAPRWMAAHKKAFTTDARAVLAAAFEARKDWAHAHNHLAALLEIQPTNGQLRRRLGVALFFLDRHDAAFQELKKAAETDPSMDPPAVMMGRLWTGKDEAKANEWFERAVREGGSAVKVRLAYADWLVKQGQVDRAKVHVEAAAKVDGKNIELRKFQGLIARIAKDTKGAETILQTVAQEVPSDFFAINNLALALADSALEADRNKAFGHAQMNAKAHGQSAEALATLGYVCWRVNRVDEALQALTAAASSGQISSDTAYFFALVLNHKEKYAEARKLLDDALKAKGLFIYRAEAEKLLDQVKGRMPKDADKAKAK